MSSTAKIWIVGIIVIVLALGAYWWMHPTGVGEPANSGQAANTTDTNTTTSGSSNQDSDFAKETASIDSQLSGLDADNASVDESFNDQPISQTY